MDFADVQNILIPIAIIQLVGWAVPGPNHLTIVTASVTAGRAAGIRAAMGIAAGGFTWTVITVSGIAIIFDLFPALFVALRLFGAGYLIYLGINAFKSARSGGMFSLTATENSPATRAPFRTAYVVMMTNPKAVLFFGSVFAAFVPANGSIWLSIAIMIQFGLIGILLNVSSAFLFSSAAFKKWFQSIGVYMSLLFGVLFCALGIYVAWDVCKGLLF